MQAKNIYIIACRYRMAVSHVGKMIDTRDEHDYALHNVLRTRNIHKHRLNSGVFG